MTRIKDDHPKKDTFIVRATINLNLLSGGLDFHRLFIDPFLYHRVQHSRRQTIPHKLNQISKFNRNIISACHTPIMYVLSVGSNILIYYVCTFYVWRRNALSKLIAKSKSQSQLDSSSWNSPQGAVSGGNVTSRQPISSSSSSGTLKSIIDGAKPPSEPSQLGDNALPLFLKGGLRRSLTQVNISHIYCYPCLFISLFFFLLLI